MRAIIGPLQAPVHRPVGPHRHAQRPGRGGLHRPRAGEGLRPAPRTSSSASTGTNDELYEASFGAQFISGIIQPAMMFVGNLNFVVIAVVGGLRVATGAMTHRRHPGLHPVLPPVHPAPHPAGVDGQRAPVGHRLRRAGLRAARRPGGVAPTRRRAADAAAGPRPGRVRPRPLLLRPRAPPHQRPVAGGRAGPDHRHRRSHRRRQDHPGQPDHALLRARRRPDPHRRRRHRHA